MKVKKCQIDYERPCADKGFACLTTDKEKSEFNKTITQIQEKLEAIKFAEPEKKNK